MNLDHVTYILTILMLVIFIGFLTYAVATILTASSYELAVKTANQTGTNISEIFYPASHPTFTLTLQVGEVGLLIIVIGLAILLVVAIFILLTRRAQSWTF